MCSTATHNIWLLAVRYRLISRFIFSLKNPLKHAPNTHWFEGWQCLFAEFAGPEDDFFMGTISLKDLVSIPLLKLNILLHIYDRKLCARPNAWTVWHEQVPCLPPPPPPQFKPQWTRRYDRRMFTLIHLSTFSGCLWLQKEIIINGRIGLFILSWSTITGYSASILSQLAKNWLVSDSSFFDSCHNILADIQWQWITTRWITLQYSTHQQMH